MSQQYFEKLKDLKITIKVNILNDWYNFTTDTILTKDILNCH